MSPGPRALRHNAFVYETEEEFVGRSVSFLRAGLEAGEGAVVAHTRPGLAVMRDALGSDASAVTFVDVGCAYTRPAKTLAAYHEVYAAELRKNASVRAVADVQFGPDPGEWDLWTGYEAVFNRSFAHLPAWVLCTYNTERLPDRVRDGVWRTHSQVLAGDGWHSSDRFEDPDDLFRGLVPAPRELTCLRPMPFGRDVEGFREELARTMLAHRVPRAKVLDMLLAATEVVTNAIEHGGGVTQVRAGRAEGRFVCEIADRGKGLDDPAAGYLAPRDGLGAGLWIARQLTWQIEFFRGDDGFTARIWL